MSDANERRGDDAFARRAWARAYDELRAADETGPLAAGDLERLALVAYLVGHDEASATAWERAQREHLERNDVRRAARCAFWLALGLLNRGEAARAGGWVRHAEARLEGAATPGPEAGLLRVLVARMHLQRGELEAGSRAADEAAAHARRFADPELAVFSRLITAQVRALHGDTAEALGLFDEIMVAVTTEPVSPIAVGVMYCAVIDGCLGALDLGRAREWTQALDRWCAEQTDLVPFRGQCLVHRIELLRLGGAWSAAIAEAEGACRWLESVVRRHEPDAAADRLPVFKVPIGAATYQLAELLRMRGELDEAEAAYRRASDYGRAPQPGLLLLRLAQGREAEAAAAARRTLLQRQSRSVRVAVLAAAVDVLLAVGDRGGAAAAAEELAGIAVAAGSPYPRAQAAHAAGAVLLAGGAAGDALEPLGEAWRAWQELDAPYEAARVRVLRGSAFRALGDEAGAGLEWDAARRVFERLRARPDVERIARLRAAGGGSAAAALSAREREVVALVATGATNRSIAEALGISKRTVDRHVSNVLVKLELPSRTAIAAYAYEHDLVRRPRP